MDKSGCKKNNCSFVRHKRRWIRCNRCISFIVKWYMLVLCQDLVQVKMRNFSPILTCQKLSLSVRSFIHSFEFVWRHIVAMAMNSFRIVESFQIFKNQLVCLLIVANFKAIEPFTFDNRMKRFNVNFQKKFHLNKIKRIKN